MNVLPIVATTDDLVVGLLLGMAIGFLAGPIVRSGVVAGERAAARREARLTDRLIERLEAMDVDDLIGDEQPDRIDDQDEERSDATHRWRTSH